LAPGQRIPLVRRFIEDAVGNQHPLRIDGVKGELLVKPPPGAQGFAVDLQANGDRHVDLFAGVVVGDANAADLAGGGVDRVDIDQAASGQGVRQAADRLGGLRVGQWRPGGIGIRGRGGLPDAAIGSACEQDIGVLGVGQDVGHRARARR
jgi:hypothetical protein